MDRRAWQAAPHGVAKSRKEIQNQRDISSFIFLCAKVKKRYNAGEIKKMFPLHLVGGFMFAHPGEEKK